MHKMLLASAAGLAATIGAPAAAQNFAPPAGGHGVQIHHGFDGPSPDGIRFVEPRHDRRDHGRRRSGDVIIGHWGDGTWALYNNRAFEPDSYNDWWHERPWRAYPRWVQSSGCDRMWWGGGAWRCSW